MEKFRNKYRIPSARLQQWDYRWAGAYFITICTEHRVHYFGEISQKTMRLSPIGAIADVLWHQIPHHAKNIELGAFVVMPNHVHGVLILHGDDANDGDTANNAANNAVETLHATSLRQPQSPPLKNEQMAHISPKSNSVSTIVRSYKSAVTRHAHRLGFEFGWQARFHDHIIRNAEAFQRISDYIHNNPANWKEDRFFQNATNEEKKKW